MKFVKYFWTILCALLSASLVCAEPVELARGGEALLPIYVAPDASPEMRKLAEELAGYLSKIVGSEFKLVSERPKHGIVLGTRAAFPEFLAASAEPFAPSARERYRLQTKDGTLAIVGETELAVQNAVFDLLHELGYRQFFPTEVWEIIPKRRDLRVDLDKTLQPAFASRSLFIALRRKPAELVEATGVKATSAAFADWQRKNRGISGYALNSGHAYNAIATRNAAAFKAHPEWVTRKGTWSDAGSGLYEPKFVVDNPELRQLVREDALRWLKEHPEADTYSIDPSDGRGWPKESSIGTPSDQATFLANDVARAVRKEFPGKRVAFYAYNLHSPPPNIDVEPEVIVSIATKFNRSNPVPELMRGWHARGAELGIRDYLAVWNGNLDMPGGGYPASNPRAYLRSLRQFYADGARYYGAEMTSGSWATCGFSIYAGMRALWSPEEGEYEPLLRDFLEKAFGKAAGQLRLFFEMIDSESYPIISEAFTGNMYATLDAGLKQAGGPAVERRILQLVAYTRYVELVDRFSRAQGAEKREAYRDLAQFAIRCREFPTIPAAEVFSRRQPLQGIWEAIGAIAFEVMAEKAAPFSEQELRVMLAERLRDSKPLGFEPKAFSRDLLSPLAAEVPAQPARNFSFSRRQTLLWLAQEGEEELPLRVISRETLDAKQPIVVALLDTEDPEGEPSFTAKLPADNQWHSVVLKASGSGLYAIELSDLAGRSEVEWPVGAPVFFSSGSGRATTAAGVYDAWFFVPAGVEIIAGYSELAEGRIVDASGEPVHSFHAQQDPGYFMVKIGASAKGRFFKFEGARGKKLLMTVPPFLARHPTELAIPRDALSDDGWVFP